MFLCNANFTYAPRANQITDREISIRSIISSIFNPSCPCILTKFHSIFHTRKKLDKKSLARSGKENGEWRGGNSSKWILIAVINEWLCTQRTASLLRLNCTTSRVNTRPFTRFNKTTFPPGTSPCARFTQRCLASNRRDYYFWDESPDAARCWTTIETLIIEHSRVTNSARG